MMASMSAVSSPANAVDVIAEISGVSPDTGIAQIQSALKAQNITIVNYTIENEAVVVSSCPPGAWCSGENITSCPKGDAF